MGDISKTTDLQLSCLVSSNTHSTSSDLHPINQYKEQEVYLETQAMMKGEKVRTTQSTSEKNDSTAYLSCNSPEINLKKKEKIFSMKPSPDSETQISTGMSSDNHDFLLKPIPLETNDLETSSPISLYVKTSTN